MYCSFTQAERDWENIHSSVYSFCLKDRNGSMHIPWMQTHFTADVRCSASTLHGTGSNSGRCWIYTVVLSLLQLLTAWSPLLHSQFPSLIPQKKFRKHMKWKWGRVASAANWIGAGGHWLRGTMGEWTGKFSFAEVPVIIRHRQRGNSPRSNAFCTCFVLSI